MLSTTVFSTTRRLRGMAGPLLIAGGVLWALTFALIVLNGALTGTLPNQPDATSPLFLRIGLRLFAFSVVVLGLGLLGFAPRLRGRGLRIAARVLIGIAIAFASANLVALSGLIGSLSYSDTLGGLSFMITSLATLLLGIAAARTPDLPRASVAAMIWIGLTTIPILFLTPLPIGPDWATDFLAFLTSGAAYIALGAATTRRDAAAAASQK